jgi:hypothetical protein
VPLVASACLAVGCGSSGTPTTTSSSSSIAQKPPAPRHRAGASVKRVTVPKLVGERFEKAVREVDRAGLQQHAPAFTGTIGNPHYKGNCKKILSQSPPPGTRLPKGATVSIVYGVCPHAIANAHHSLKKGG